MIESSKDEALILSHAHSIENEAHFLLIGQQAFYLYLTSYLKKSIHNWCTSWSFNDSIFDKYLKRSSFLSDFQLYITKMEIILLRCFHMKELYVQLMKLRMSFLLAFWYDYNLYFMFYEVEIDIWVIWMFLTRWTIWIFPIIIEFWICI